MKAYPVVLTFFLLASCSSTHEVETKSFGVQRVEFEQEDYERPQLYVKKFDFKKVQERKPASLIEREDQKNLSNRQLYFLTYYKQYLSLGEMLGKENTINICPSFHDVLVTNKKDIEPSVIKLTSMNNMKSVKTQKDLVVNYPVLAIPYSSDQDLFSKLENEKWDETEETVRLALEHYYEIEKREVQSLCDKGVSPGYYIFENLVTYFKNDESFHRTQDGLQALLKVPVISNMIILDSILGHKILSSNTTAFDQTLMLRSNLGWFSEYRDHLKNKRNHLITVKNEQVYK